MRSAVEQIEYEQMLLSRYSIAQHQGDRDLERSAYVLLSRLEAQGPMSISELSTALRLDASTLQRQTSAALRSGLIERRADPSGGIARKLAISEEGARRLAAVRARYVASMSRVLDGWSDSEAEMFALLLRKFNQSIEVLRGEHWPRIDGLD